MCVSLSVCALSHRAWTVGQFLTWGAQSLSTPAGQEVCNMGTMSPPVLLWVHTCHRPLGTCWQALHVSVVCCDAISLIFNSLCEEWPQYRQELIQIVLHGASHFLESICWLASYGPYICLLHQFIHMYMYIYVYFITKSYRLSMIGIGNLSLCFTASFYF